MNDLTSTDAHAMRKFFGRVREGCGKHNAAYEVGWSPQKLRKFEHDVDFKQMFELSRERMLEDIEETTVRQAKAGNTVCIQMVLYGHPERGWRPPQQRIQVDSTTTHRLEVVTDAKELLRQMMLEGGVEALEQPFKREAIEAQAS